MIFAFLLSIVSSSVRADDVSDSHDHPLVNRYPDSTIVHFEEKDYGQFNAAIGPSKWGTKIPQKTVEGKVTRIVYTGPSGRSVLEIFKNYESALKKAGFQTVFTGDQKTIGNLFGEVLYGHTGINLCLNPDSTKSKGDPERYVFARLPRGKSNIWFALFATWSRRISGKCDGNIHIDQVIVEEKSMESDLVTFNAKAMAKALEETGHVAIYGILFDTDKAILKPESDPTLKEISILLKTNPKLSLDVVGHTDWVGTPDHNLELSRARAAATVQTLKTKYGVTESRLIPHGVGSLSPIGSNRSDQGRAKNRRVELIERNPSKF